MNKKEGKADLEETKSPGKFQVFLLIFLVPAAFLLIASVIVLTLLDINPITKAKEAGIEIPFLSDGQEVEPENSSAENGEQTAFLQTQLKEKETNIAELEKELSSLTAENEKLSEEQERLVQETANQQNQQETEKSKNNEMVSVFKEMKGKTAAPVLLNMSEEEAVAILSQLPSDSVASIFEEMPPEDAAKYAVLLGIQAP
ncbi:MotE family protein [Jeotgalibacillus campisalis]|uniref:Magnesium transporter MgtE intracellular domain-containing protein n=1 Tax=Jeotgalibacillus campisalis TaxID=220754 RepID=A0A0C2S0Z1_9BACL|nr:MotE family protein [Jeotgalibacillus campisalis]KIL47719.1 hypothetical protein KR50_18860 [Jeotgalibacillus campisalis]